MNLYYEQPHLRITGISPFDLSQTVNCGQCFRFVRDELRWRGVAQNRVLCVYQPDEDTLIMENTTPEDFYEIWQAYFDLDRDYSAVINAASTDPVLSRAAAFAGGIHILKQDPWETLCSFILSQNNNIPRITGIINRLCANFGTQLAEDFFSFPGADVIAALSDDDLAVLRCGFRLRYIKDAAQKVANGNINLASVFSMDTGLAREYLKQICGVGNKVADCVLLFAYAKIDAFPTDVWIGRAMETLFPKGLPSQAEPYKGIIQQQLFHYVRQNPDVLTRKQDGNFNAS